MRLGEIGPDLHRLPVTGDRFFQLALVLERIAQVVVGIRMIGVVCQGLSITRDCFLQLALVLEHVAQVIVRIGIIRG